MFTGIVAAIGHIESIEPIEPTEPTEPLSARAGIRLTVRADGLSLDDVALGDSIAIEGACMTVIAKTADTFSVEVSRESLACTTGLAQLGEVNLEKALRANDRLGGHLVAGHVDGIGVVTHFAPVGESHELRILTSREIGRYLAYKGSIAVNGVSLTVNAVTDREDGCECSINLIAHTVAMTTLKRLAPGEKVNLEVDLIARYVERMMNAPRENDRVTG